MGISFSLRDGVRWSDGNLFSADDVIFSFTIALKYPELDSHGIGQWVESIEKRNKNEVYFRLKKPNALVAYTLVLLPIVPKHQWQAIDNYAHFTNPTPIGTGPFTEIKELDENGYLQCTNLRIGRQRNCTSIACAIPKSPPTTILFRVYPKVSLTGPEVLFPISNATTPRTHPTSSTGCHQPATSA